MGNDPIQPERQSNDPLDQLLQQAAWPEPDQASLMRLESHWEAIRPRDRSAVLWSVMGIAAALLVMGWFLWDFGSVKHASQDRRVEPIEDSDPRPLKNHQTPEIPPVPKDPSDQGIGTKAREQVPRSYAGRDLNSYEQVVYRILEHRDRTSNRAANMAKFQHAIDQLVEDPDIDIAAVAEPLRAETVLFERALVRTVRYGQGPRRNAAIRLLGELSGDRSLKLLVMLSRQRGTRTVAIQTLIRFAESETIFHLAASESDIWIQKELARALLERDDSRSKPAYLELVANRATTIAALGALQETDAPSIDAFLVFLDSDESHLRKAAAVVLAQINGPETAHRLIQMVQEGQGVEGALLALMLSRNSNAAQFLEYASHDVSLIAAVNLARCQAQLLLN